MMAVVCPTPRGGHIEHAANIALTVVESNANAIVVSRRGSRKYLAAAASSIRVVELFPDIQHWRIPRFATAAVTLLLENLLLLTYLVANRRKFDIVLLEEPRFPAVCFMRHALPALVLFAHNAFGHDGLGSAWTRAQDKMQGYMISRIPSVVHGEAQASTLESSHVSGVHQVPLPGIGPVERLLADRADPPHELLDEIGQAFVLCLGDIRENKGVHHAIAAARAAGCRLVIAGPARDIEYLQRLRGEVAEGILLIPRFLRPGEFSWLLAHCSALVLPYGDFGAQSGPLSRAMALDVPVILSANVSLIEQSQDYPRRHIVDPSNVTDLAHAMCGAIQTSGQDRSSPDPDATQRAGWAAVVEAVYACAGTRLGDER